MMGVSAFSSVEISSGVKSVMHSQEFAIDPIAGGPNAGTNPYYRLTAAIPEKIA
jgi:hypothetical protein